VTFAGQSIRIKAKGTDLDGRPINGATFVGTARVTIYSPAGVQLAQRPLVWDAAKALWTVDYELPPVAGIYRLKSEFFSTEPGNSYYAVDTTWVKSHEIPD
jgi:hypothetical protein